MLTKVTGELLNGFSYNLIIFFVTLILGVPLGMFITFGEMSKISLIRVSSRAFVWLIRGTPLMLQLFVVLYVPGLLFGMPFKQRLTAALIAFVINYAAYFAEIFRGAIENIPSMYLQAGEDLGASKRQIFFKIVLGIIIIKIIPPMGNEIITLIKDTSLARVIAIPEILMNATDYSSQGLIWPLFYTAIFFLLGTAILTLTFNRLERKYQYDV